MARPTLFKEAYIPITQRLYEMGHTDAEVAHILGISVSTLYNWCKKHPEFLQSLKRGKASYDDRVERALAERAMGYSHPHEKLFLREGEVIRVQTTKHYPPDTTAAIFWLKNRRPEQWRDKREVNTTDSKEYINIIQQRRAKALASLQAEKPLAS